MDDEVRRITRNFLKSNTDYPEPGPYIHWWADAIERGDWDWATDYKKGLGVNIIKELYMAAQEVLDEC